MAKTPVASSTEISTDVRPEWATKGSAGNEQVSHSDTVIPRLALIQDLSPQRKKTEPEYIEGADSGMMFNSVTGELYKDPLLVIPVYYRREFLVWVDRKAGGGLRGVFLSEHDANKSRSEQAAAATTRGERSESTEVVETAQNFCLISSDSGNSWSEAVLSMSKASFGVARKWNSAILMRESDRFAQVYTVYGEVKTNAKGSFYVFGIKWHRWARDSEYAAGKACYKAIKDGAKDVSRDYRDDAPPATANTHDDEDLGF